MILENERCIFVGLYYNKNILQKSNLLFHRQNVKVSRGNQRVNIDTVAEVFE